MKKRVLVIYETAGGGHLADAKAIEMAFKLRYPEHEVFLVQMAIATKSRRVATLYDSYNNMLKIDPRLVRYGFVLLNSFNAERTIIPLIPKAARNVKECLRQIDPDIVVSVFGVANYVIHDAMKDLGWIGQRPFVIFVTDLTDFLRSWAHPEADLMVAMVPETRAELITYGMDPARIKVLGGMPVNPRFCEAKPSEVARKELGLAQDRFTVLITLGAVAGRHTVRFTKELADSGLPLQLIVACGRNAGLKRKIDRLAAWSRIPIKVMGFTDQMPLLMDAGDVAVIKPGAVTVAEVIQKQLPTLIDAIHPPMPQERSNMELVAGKGLARKIDRQHPVSSLVNELMTYPDRYARMRRAGAELKNEDAIYQLCQLILDATPFERELSSTTR